MQTFDQSLFYLYKSELITLEEAMKRASNPDEFRLKLEGVQFTGDEAREQMESGLDMGAGDVLVGRDKFDSPAAARPAPRRRPDRALLPRARAAPARPAASSGRRSG